MDLKPWHKVVTPRKEVREGRSFNPDEFAIHLEQIISGSAPDDYKLPAKFFSRSYFTRALRDHTGMVLRRLAGETTNTSPVLTLVTAFGGGKTHTLTTLYHLVKNPGDAANFAGVKEMLIEAGLTAVPNAKVGVFVGNAWDPQPGRETPWIDLARQLAGDDGVALLGKSAESAPPGTETLNRVFEAAGGSVLVLCDEVLNFLNRHRNMADPFYAFIQNLTVAMTGTPRSAAVISLPRSQVEMTDFDIKWQEKITKVVHRVSKDLIANDEAEISEVVRRRLFEDLGDKQTRLLVAKTYADWCFERSERLPSEWTSVDSSVSAANARQGLMERFEACYPFHPATLSVFQRKWQALSHFQQTRSTLAMLAQWISWAYKDGFTKARKEPLITIGSAPLDVNDFRSVVLGQLGEPRLGVGIEVDIAGEYSHARALDADIKGDLRDIHRRVGTAILFESTGGQAEKIAHLPELRFALGEPDVETTSIDTAAILLESKAFYIRKVGTDGFRIRYQPTLKKVMNDRRASLDEDAEIKPAIRKLIENEFERGRTLPITYFPADSSVVSDNPRLNIVVLDPETEWTGNGGLRKQLADWTHQRNNSSRFYPGALVWCIKKPGRDLRVQTERWLAWRRVKHDMDQGNLGHDFDAAELEEIEPEFKDANSDAKDEVWACYRYVVIADSQEVDGLRVIDLGQGHAGGGETLCGRVISALKAENLLNESVGAGYIERNWPPALVEAGAWPLSSLRKCFLDGSLTRLLDPDTALRAKILEFVQNSEFGLASGRQPDGDFTHLWFGEIVSSDEVIFETDVYLLHKFKAAELQMKALRGKTVHEPEPTPQMPLAPEIIGGPEVIVIPIDQPIAGSQEKTLRLVGTIPSEMWNRLGTKIIPKMKSAGNPIVSVEFVVKTGSESVQSLKSDLEQIIADLGIGKDITIEIK